MATGYQPRQNKPALDNPLLAPSRSRRVATNLNLKRRGALGSGCQASTLGPEMKTFFANNSTQIICLLLAVFGLVLLVTKGVEHHLIGDLEWLIYWAFVAITTTIATAKLGSVLPVAALSLLFHLVVSPFCFHPWFIVANLIPIFIATAIGAFFGWMILRKRRRPTGT